MKGRRGMDLQPAPPLKTVSKQEFTKMTNRFGESGNGPRCPHGCGGTWFRSSTKTAPSAFVCDVCKTEIRGA